MTTSIMDLPSNSDWASLPSNLLDSILDYLVPMEDYIRFGEVCIGWLRAVLEKLGQLRTNHKRHCGLHQQVPWLMAPPTGNTRYDCCLYDVMKGKSVCEFQRRPWMKPSYRMAGSSHGWLILVENCYKVTLLNPLSEKHIRLPAMDKSIFQKRSMRVLSYPDRGVLSNDPDQNHNEFVLMMICSGLEGRLAFIQSGEKDWTYIRDMRYLQDIVYSNGLFYALDARGVLFSCDISSTDIEIKMITGPVADQNDIVHNSDFIHNTYLVESPEGDFLRVIRIDARFVIYKLVWFSRNVRWNPRWIEVTSLGDVALFLGDNHSTSVTASDFTGCRSNSIYICQSRPLFSMDINGLKGVFSLDDRIVTPLYPHSRPPRLWISSKVE